MVVFDASKLHQTTGVVRWQRPGIIVIPLRIDDGQSHLMPGAMVSKLSVHVVEHSRHKPGAAAIIKLY